MSSCCKLSLPSPSISGSQILAFIPHSTSYVGARLIWGGYNSYKLYFVLFSSVSGDQRVPGSIKYLYAALNVLMNSLNLFWFRAMVLALKKRYARSLAALPALI